MFALQGIGDGSDLYVFKSVGDSVSIGRDSRKCEIARPAAANGVSRVHATVVCDDEEYLVLTDTSTYGTIVDGVEVMQNSQRLMGGERIAVGDYEMLVKKLRESPPPTPPPVARSSARQKRVRTPSVSEEMQVVKKTKETVMEKKTTEKPSSSRSGKMTDFFSRNKGNDTATGSSKMILASDTQGTIRRRAVPVDDDDDVSVIEDTPAETPKETHIRGRGRRTPIEKEKSPEPEKELVKRVEKQVQKPATPAPVDTSMAAPLSTSRTVRKKAPSMLARGGSKGVASQMNVLAADTQEVVIVPKPTSTANASIVLDSCATMAVNKTEVEDDYMEQRQEHLSPAKSTRAASRLASQRATQSRTVDNIPEFSDDDDDFVAPRSLRFDDRGIHSQMNDLPKFNSTQKSAAAAPIATRRSTRTTPAKRPLSSQGVVKEEVVEENAPAEMPPPAKKRGRPPKSAPSPMPPPVIEEDEEREEEVSILKEKPGRRTPASRARAMPVPVRAASARTTRKVAAVVEERPLASMPVRKEEVKTESQAANEDQQMFFESRFTSGKQVQAASQELPPEGTTEYDRILLETTVRMENIVQFVDIERPSQAVRASVERTPAPSRADSASRGKGDITQAARANFKRFKKASQGRFNTTLSGGACAVDLVDHGRVRRDMVMCD